MSVTATFYYRNGKPERRELEESDIQPTIRLAKPYKPDFTRPFADSTPYLPVAIPCWTFRLHPEFAGIVYIEEGYGT